jgi:ferric-dicitrate binding protein FerR (iron transport regulator)
MRREDADELALLHGRLVEDDLDAEGREQLRLLLADPAQRARFVAVMRIDGGLCGLLRTGPAAARRRARRTLPVRRTAIGWITALAAGLLLVVGVLAWLQPRSAATGETAPVLARWADQDGRPGLSAGADASGPGELVLNDGSRLGLSGGTSLTIETERIRQRAGRLQVAAKPQLPGHQLVVETANATVRVVGTAFAVTVAADGTTVAVESGRVQVQPHQAAAQELSAGTALFVPAVGEPHAVPAETWSIDLADAQARIGWFGTGRNDGLALAFDAKTSKEFAIDTWNVQLPDPGRLGIAAFDTASRLQASLTLSAPTAMAVHLQMWSADGSRWLGSAQRTLDLPSGRQELDLPLAGFEAKQGAALAEMRGMPIRRLSLIAWSGSVTVVVHRLGMRR